MNYYIWLCVFAVVAVQCALGNPEETLANNPLVAVDELKLNNFTTKCNKAGLYCKSCTELIMCVETESGWTEQHVASCTGQNSCYEDRCISGHNIECHGTKDIPFKCHVPGAFPDPFDCQAYHLCVLTTETEGNNQTEVLKDFKHICPKDGFQSYRYDPKSTYCKYEIWGNKCPKLPVPVCKYAGQMDALIENDSIYYICEQINDAIYPNLYSCPHGRIFWNNRCVKDYEISTTPDYPTTYPTTAEPTTYPTTPEPSTYPTTPEPTTYPTTPEPTTYPTTPDPTTTQYTTDYTTYSTSYPTDYSTYSTSYPTDYTTYSTSYPTDYTTSYPTDYTTSYPTDYTTSYPTDYTTSYPTDYTTSYPTDYTTSYPTDYTTYSTSYPTEGTTSYTTDYTTYSTFSAKK